MSLFRWLAILGGGVEAGYERQAQEKIFYEQMNAQLQQSFMNQQSAFFSLMSTMEIPAHPDYDEALRY